MPKTEEEVRTDLEKRVFSTGREYTPAELAVVLGRPLRRDLRAISTLMGGDPTLGSALVELGLSLDNFGNHALQLKRMDQANSNLWSNLHDLVKMLGSSYKISDLGLENT